MLTGGIYVNFFSSSAANKCLLKVAMYAAQQEDYLRAITIYEEVCKLYYSPFIKAKFF